MLTQLFALLFSLFLVVRGATISTKYAVRLSNNYHIPKYVIGLIIVAMISILPETFIALNSSFKDIPEFGLGTLFGSNVADLTLVFAIILFFAGKNIKVQTKILKNSFVYPFIFFLPLIVGMNGHYSRLEGLFLIFVGILFYYFEFKNGLNNAPSRKIFNGKPIRNFLLLLLGMGFLLVGSHFTVIFGSNLAEAVGIPPILIGLLIIGLGTTIPEMLFALHAVKQGKNSLAIGDILGTVLADATIVVGLLALVNPFSFEKNIIFITGFFMLLSAFLLSYFLRTEKTLTRKEGLFLLLFWIVFACVEYFFNT